MKQERACYTDEWSKRLSEWVIRKNGAVEERAEVKLVTSITDDLLKRRLSVGIKQANLAKGIGIDELQFCCLECGLSTSSELLELIDVWGRSLKVSVDDYKQQLAQFSRL